MLNNFILKEGFKSIITILVVSVLLDFFISDFLAIIGYLLAVLFVFLYRNSDNKLTIASTVSPINGKIIAIDIKNGDKLLYIEKSLCTSSVLRAPKNGTLKILNQRFGLNLDSSKYRAKKLNTSKTFELGDIVITLLSGVCTTTNSLDSQIEYKQGEKIGVFTHGLLTLKINALNDDIKIGSKLICGETILN